MSEWNGDKARFARLRKRKIFVRKSVREFMKKLENTPTGPTLAAPELVRIGPAMVDSTG